MTPLQQWAHDWGLPPIALTDLANRLDPPAPAATGLPPKSEAAVQQAIRLAVQERGGRVWRNNVGAAQDPNGRWVRYGLANDSKAVNDRLKSADLIGVLPVTLGPEHVGHTVGQFVSIECKAPGWTYRGTDREAAQRNWQILIQSLGGYADMTGSTTAL